MARIRSPNYPAISLAEAIKRVGQIHAKERQHPCSKEVVIKGMGYSGVHGVSLGALSALVKYGLLDQEGRGEDYRVSDRAVAILHPHSTSEKTAAINEAARSPALFNELLDHFKGSLPSDDNLRAYLVRKGFSQTSLANVIQSFRETMELVSPDSSGYDSSQPLIEEEASMQGASVADRDVQARSARQAPPSLPVGTGRYEGNIHRATLPIDEGVAALEMPARVSKKSINAMKLWLELLLKLAESDSPSADEQK